MTNKEKYRLLCENEPTIPIFSKDWWLDAVAEDEWDVTLVEKGGAIVASLPYMVKKKYGLKVLSQPALTQHLGPWLRPTNVKYATRLDQEKELLQDLYSKLPKYDMYQQNWYLKNRNWLPLYWLGYQQTTRYTYRFEDLSDIDKIWNELQSSVRSHVKKAEERFGLSLKESPSIEEFIELNVQVFERQGMQLPYSKDLMRRIDNAASENNARKIFLAVDEKGVHHAALYLVWDDESSYCLMSGSVPELRKSGAISFCRWNAIKYSANVTKSFDFEGSMIEPVERFFRGFGAVQTPYFSISKTNSKLLKTYKFLQDLRK